MNLLRTSCAAAQKSKTNSNLIRACSHKLRQTAYPFMGIRPPHTDIRRSEPPGYLPAAFLTAFPYFFKSLPKHGDLFHRILCTALRRKTARPHHIPSADAKAIPLLIDACGDQVRHLPGLFNGANLLFRSIHILAVQNNSTAAKQPLQQRKFHLLSFTR